MITKRIPVFIARSATWLVLSVAFALLTGCATGTRNTIRSFDTVVIDAGHGGKDRGATKHGVREKDVALDVALRLERHLKDAGYKTVMTRRSDVFVELNDRAAISNRYRDAVFVSVHFNYGRRLHAKGAETFYYSAPGKIMAEEIGRKLGRITDYRGTKKAKFRVLKRNKNPAVLVECGFLTNPRDAARAKSPLHREKLADCIFDALRTVRGPRQPSS